MKICGDVLKSLTLICIYMCFYCYVYIYICIYIHTHAHIYTLVTYLHRHTFHHIKIHTHECMHESKYMHIIIHTLTTYMYSICLLTKFLIQGENGKKKKRLYLHMFIVVSHSLMQMKNIEYMVSLKTEDRALIKKNISPPLTKLHLECDFTQPRSPAPRVVGTGLFC